MIRTTHFRVAAFAGLVWVAFQVAMMLYSRNLTAGSAALNAVPVLVLSLGALRGSRPATIALAAYGALRLWMAFPILTRLSDDGASLPKHWWIALVAIPFAFLWIFAAWQSERAGRRLMPY